MSSLTEASNVADPRFRGSDDDLRARFEEYICAALSTVKYSDFLAKGKAGDISIVGVGKSFSPLPSYDKDLLM